MRPEQELDTLVAEKIMGWVKSDTFENGFCLPDGTHVAYDFRPSTNILYAWKVIEKMQLEWAWNMDMYNEALEVEVNIGKGSCTNRNVPYAICIAALRAIGIKVEDE